MDTTKIKVSASKKGLDSLVVAVVVEWRIFLLSRRRSVRLIY